jgi:hypothetical protein
VTSLDEVTHVLLSDGWHAVADQSFGLDFTPEAIWRGGFVFRDDVPFTPESAVVSGPLASVIAVRTTTPCRR